MSERLQFSTWSFGPDLVNAYHRETGEAIHFTRTERALLLAFIESSGRVLQRELLLDVVSGLDSEVADRSIDFVIHRLRRKLQDSARDPSYIATQYGEGYVWIAEPISIPQPASGAFVVVGPLRGLGFAPRLADRGRQFAKTLTEEIDRLTAPENRTVLDRHCPAPETFDGEPPQLAVTLSFLETSDGRLECALSLRRFASGTIIKIDRIMVCDEKTDRTAERDRAVQLARKLTDAIWFSLHDGRGSDASPDVAPLSISLHEASERLVGSRETWLDAEQRLRLALREAPDDYQAKLMLASALHSRYVLSDPTVPIASAVRRRDEAEIETLVTSALPHLQDNGIYALTAAKLLYFVNKTHRKLSMELAECAFASTTAFATAFALLAQLHMWEGQMDEARTLYEQGQELATRGSHFHLYILVLKAHAHMAMGFDGSPAADEIYSVKPVTRSQLALFLAPTHRIDLSAEITAFLNHIDETGARACIRHLHYIAARHFQFGTHRKNLLRRPVRLLLERFGSRFIPEDIRADIPSDLLLPR